MLQCTLIELITILYLVLGTVPRLMKPHLHTHAEQSFCVTGPVQFSLLWFKARQHQLWVVLVHISAWTSPNPMQNDGACPGNKPQTQLTTQHRGHHFNHRSRQLLKVVPIMHLWLCCSSFPLLRISKFNTIHCIEHYLKRDIDKV